MKTRCRMSVLIQVSQVLMVPFFLLLFVVVVGQSDESS